MAEMIKRGVDPLRFDRRPFSKILDDEIPEARWARERRSKRN